MSDAAIVGICGWKNSGKTTLVSGLVAALTRQGYSVSTIKHAHHAFDLDQPGTDSYSHRQAGAMEVALVSSNRWAIQHESNSEPEPTLAQMLERLSPCDVIIAEGYKRESIPKIEIIGPDQKETDWLWPNDSQIMAVAADEPPEKCELPFFRRGDVIGIAGFLIEKLELARK